MNWRTFGSHFILAQIGGKRDIYTTTAATLSSNLSSVYDQGWTLNQQALPTGVDILGTAVWKDATAAEVNTNLVGPEPMNTSLLAGGLALILWRRTLKSVQ